MVITTTLHTLRRVRISEPRHTAANDAVPGDVPPADPLLGSLLSRVADD